MISAGLGVACLVSIAANAVCRMSASPASFAADQADHVAGDTQPKEQANVLAVNLAPEVTAGAVTNQLKRDRCGPDSSQECKNRVRNCRCSNQALDLISTLPWRTRVS